jgi:anthranilate phosphoribosyltransferase
MIKEAIGLVVSGTSLTVQEAELVMQEIMKGEATPAQLGAFFTALKLKGETVDEITGFARAMRDNAIHVDAGGPVLDIVGTGGDGSGSINISTGAAFIAAAAGLKVAKHGNRAMSSKCGSADVLEALGVKIDLDAGQVQKCLKEVGISFMFAQVFHPAMKYAAAPRREIGIRTVFNILGPLTNPAGAGAQVLGVASEQMVNDMSLVLQGLGCEHALVVHGEDGMDEITVSGKTFVSELKNGRIESYTITPEDFGISRADMQSLRGGEAKENAGMLRGVLSGVPGPQRDVMVMNAAAGMLAGDRVETLSQGVALAAEMIDSGKALEKLDRLIAYSNSVGRE